MSQKPPSERRLMEELQKMPDTAKGLPEGFSTSESPQRFGTRVEMREQPAGEGRFNIEVEHMEGTAQSDMSTRELLESIARSLENLAERIVDELRNG